MSKIMTQLEKDKEALELVYNNKDRFCIATNDDNQYIAYDKVLKAEGYIFGDSRYFVKLLLDYCELA